MRSCSTRSSFTCTAGVMSPISSRKSVPPLASSKRPGFGVHRAGEGALLVAEQLALEQRLGQRARATPRRTACCRAARAGGWRARPAPCRCRLAVDHDGRARRRDLLDRLEHLEHARVRRDDPVDVVVAVELLAQALDLGGELADRAAPSRCASLSSSRSNGLVRYSVAPAFIASTAVSTLPCAVSMMTGNA